MSWVLILDSSLQTVRLSIYLLTVITQNVDRHHYFLFTFLLAALAALTNVLWSFPFFCSLNSPTTPRLSSDICSMVSGGYWHPRNSMLPKVFARPIWTQRMNANCNQEYYICFHTSSFSGNLSLWNSMNFFLSCQWCFGSWSHLYLSMSQFWQWVIFVNVS